MVIVLKHTITQVMFLCCTEQRLMVNAQMGVGNKPCLDLKPSKDNISDRAINMTKGRLIEWSPHLCQ